MREYRRLVGLKKLSWPRTKVNQSGDTSTLKKKKTQFLVKNTRSSSGQELREVVRQSFWAQIQITGSWIVRE